MEKKNRLRLITSLVALLMAIGIQAQTMVPCVVVETNDGKNTKILLSTAPRITFVEDKVQLTTNTMQILFDVDNVKKVYLSETEPFLLGDINDDGKVDVTDYIGVANCILNVEQEGFNERAADVDENGKIDVSDYIGVANIILTGSPYGNTENSSMTRKRIIIIKTQQQSTKTIKQ
jgi:hypothetical protein